MRRKAVGHDNLVPFFQACARLLAPGGRAVFQMISIPDERYETYRRESDWIRKHVFPGGHLPSLRVLRSAVAAAGFAVEGVEDIGSHYATTLRRWRERLLARRAEASALGFGERALRLWEYYFSYCEAGFARGDPQLPARALAPGGGDRAVTRLAAARLVNLALYQAGWFACVLGGARGRPWLGAAAGLALVLVQLAFVERRAEETKFVALAPLAGTAIDSAQQSAGTAAFPSGHYAAWLCPAWLTVLWAQFATLPRHSPAWLAGRPAACALLGAAGGPLAFFAGERLGGVTFPAGRAVGYGVLALVWAAVFPLLMHIAVRSPRSGMRWRR